MSWGDIEGKSTGVSSECGLEVGLTRTDVVVASPTTEAPREEGASVDRRFTVTTVAVFELVFEGILDFLARLLEVALDLVEPALHLHLLVVELLSRRLLGLALGDLCDVLGLVLLRHFCSPYVSTEAFATEGTAQTLQVPIPGPR